MATRYIVASGTWDASDTSIWSASSGGAPGASAPTSSDDVVCDGSSGASPVVTIATGAVCRSFTASAPTSGNLTLAGTAVWSIHGSLTFYSGLIRSANWQPFFKAASGSWTITLAGVSVFASVFQGAGTWVFQDAFEDTNNITHQNGTIDTNGQAVTALGFLSNQPVTRTLTLGASVLTLGVFGFDLHTGVNLTFNPGTSLIRIIVASGSPTLNLGTTTSHAAYDIDIIPNNATANIRFLSTISCRHLYIDFTAVSTTAAYVAFLGGVTHTITGTLTIAGHGNTTTRVIVQTCTSAAIFSFGTQATLSVATLTTSNSDWRDIVGAGAASWNLSAISGLSGDCGGNSGITFTSAATQYWQHGASASYNTSDATRWFLGSGGTGGAGRVPLPQDTARFDSGSFSAGSKTVVQNMPRIGPVDWTGVTNTPTWSPTTAASFFGSITLVSGMTLTASTAQYTYEGRGSSTITSAGKAWGKPFVIDCVGGTLTMQDAMSITAQQLTLTSGTFDSNGFTFTASFFGTTGSATRVLTLGASTWILDGGIGNPWNVASATGFTLNSGTSTIKLTGTLTAARTFGGAGLTYYNFWNATAGAFAIQFTGSNTFNELRHDSGRTWLNTAGTTQSFSSLIVDGVTIGSITAASHTLTKLGGGLVVVDAAIISRSTGSPGSTFYATNSTDGGNNSGWSFVVLETLTGTDTATPSDTGGLAIVAEMTGTDSVTPSDTGALEVESASDPTYRPDAHRQVVLVEVTPSITVAAWTLHTGSAWWAVVIKTVRAGSARLYRKVVGVRMNATDLIEDSLANVEAFPGCYFWDEATGRLYVHAPGSVDPATMTVQAFVTYYLATEGRVIAPAAGQPNDGIYYSPWVIGDLPRLSRRVSDILFGLTVSESGGVTFANGSAAWHDLIPTHNWRNKRVRFFLGQYGVTGAELYRADFVPVATMLIEDVAADEEVAAFKLAPLPRLMDAEIPETPFTRSAYPNLGEGVGGTRKWLGWGRATIRPDLTDTAGNGVWTVADAAYQTLFAVHDVVAVATSGGARVGLTLGVDYSVDLTLCTITILNATYAWGTHAIECDVTGKADGSGSYLKTFGQIVKDLLTAHIGVKAGDIDTASFTQADVDAPEELAVWIKEPRSLASLVSSSEPGRPSLERSVLGSLRQTLDGKWNVRIWNGAAASVTTVSMEKKDFATFQPEPKVESVVSRTRVHFAFDESVQEWSVETATDPVAEYLSETKDAMDVFTFLTSDIDALTLAQRLMLLSAAQSTEVEFSERAAKLVSELAGNYALVTFSPAPVAGGAFAGEALEILRLDISLSPTLSVSGRLGDLRAVGDRVGHWTDDSAPDWASASAEQRATQGFWCDDDGRIDPGDAMTEDQSLWW